MVRRAIRLQPWAVLLSAIPSYSLCTGHGAFGKSISTPSSSSAVKLAIDLSFGDQMNPKERRSLANQIVRCYGHNLKAQRPLALHLTALDPTSKYPDSLPADHLRLG